MGSGASALSRDDLRSQIYGGVDPTAVKGWMNADDVQDFQAAKDELKRLRQLAHSQLGDSGNVPLGGTTDKKKARAAVMDRGQVATGTYEEKIIPKPDAVREMLVSMINQNVLFRHCKKEDKRAIVDAFDLVEFEAGQEVIRQGDQGDNFYVVESGRLDVYLGDLKVGSQLSEGTSFGELALMYNTPRAATIKSATACKLWFIDRMTFRTIVTYFSSERTKRYCKFLSAVNLKNLRPASSGEAAEDEKTTLGQCLSKEQLEHLAGALEEEVFTNGEFIIRQGNVGDYFYILEEGEVDVHKTEDGKGELSDATRVGTLKHPGEYFGEKALLSEDTRKASCVAVNLVKCLTLAREDFVMMLGKLDDLMHGAKEGGSGAEEEEEKAAGTSGGPEQEVIQDLSELKGHDTEGGKFFGERILGCGAFGRVKLVSHLKTNKTYALKVQSKQAIVDNSLQEHILNERLILLQLNHPFILAFHGAFKDDSNIYFVLELLLGGELFTHLRQKGHFPESEAKFYGAQVLTAFSHIHSKKIAYRDLKPENLVLNKEGYIKIVDFGLAKVVDGKTWTLCGTPDYLAPEIILNEGHDKAVDYWALGVLIFEMVSGMPPFYAEDPMEVYEKILSATMTIPSHFSKNLSDIVRKLLKIYQSKRLGNGKGGCMAIQKHKWFSSFDFDGLLQFALTPPIVPTVEHDADGQNFDSYEDDAVSPPCLDWEPEFD